MEEDYKSWEDFLDEDEEVSEKEASDQPDLEYLKDQVELPDSVKALLEKRQQAEDHLKQLTGEAPPDPEEERQRLMYPIKVHTKETRIEERQERKEQEKKHFLKLKTLEEKVANRRVEERRHIAQQEATEARKRRERIQAAWSARQEANRLKQLQYEKAKALQEEATANKLAAAALKKRLIEKEQRDVYEQLDQRLERTRDGSFVEQSGHEKPLIDRGLDVSDDLPTLDQNKSKAKKPESFDVDKGRAVCPIQASDSVEPKPLAGKKKTDEFSIEIKRNRKERSSAPKREKKPTVPKEDAVRERQIQREKLRKEKAKQKIAAAEQQRRQENQRLAELEELRKQQQQEELEKVKRAQLEAQRSAKQEQDLQRLRQFDALRKQRLSERLQQEQEAKRSAQKAAEQELEAQRIAKLEALREERRKAKLKEANTAKPGKPLRSLQESEEQRLTKLDALRKQRQAEQLKKIKAIQPKSGKPEEVTAQKEKRWQHTEELRRARLTQLRSQQDTQRKRAQQRQAAIERLKQQKAEMEAFERKREQLRQASLRRKQGHDDMAI